MLGGAVRRAEAEPVGRDHQPVARQQRREVFVYIPLEYDADTEQHEGRARA